MTRPFLARGSKVDRCSLCLLAQRVCICRYRFLYQAKSRFLLLMHHNEGFKPSNTGRLIEDCIVGTERFEWSRTEPADALLNAINRPDIDPYIVFPEGEGYRDRMVPFEEKSAKQPVFIILDGTWRQARRMFRLSRYLDHIPVIQPQSVGSSRYRLRKAAVHGQLCTAEVAAEMLALVGDQLGRELLSAYFDIFNAHYRAARMSRPLVEETTAKVLLSAYQQGKDLSAFQPECDRAIISQADLHVGSETTGLNL